MKRIKPPLLQDDSKSKGKWSFIKTSQKILDQGKQSPAGDNKRINQADNLSEGEPDIKDSEIGYHGSLPRP